MRERRGDKDHVLGGQTEVADVDRRGPIQRRVGLQHSLGLTGGAGREQELSRRLRSRSIGADLAAVQGHVVKRQDVSQRRNSLAQAPGHRRVIMTAELVGDDQHPCPALTQHELQLVFSEDRHQRFAHGADPHRAERDRDELEQVRQLVGDGLAGPDAELEQTAGPALGCRGQLVEGPAALLTILADRDHGADARPLAGVKAHELGDQWRRYLRSPSESGTRVATSIGIPSAFI